MVERLKDAIAKARVERERVLADGGAAAAPRAAPPRPGGLWQAVPTLDLNSEHLSAQRIVTHSRLDASYMAFDVLRTRLMKSCKANDWRRIGVISPSKGCGKSTVTVNLAFSIARQLEGRAILMDMDLRLPQLATLLGVRDRFKLADFLLGETAPEEALRRVSDNLLLGLNTTRAPNAAELVQSSRVAATLDALIADAQPQVVLYDLPPLLVVDDTTGFLPNLDAVLIVAAAGQTHASEIVECERLLDGANIVGVTLNKCDVPVDAYQADYG